MQYLLALFCIFLTSAAYCAQIAKGSCIADENMVWVESNQECIPVNPCETEHSAYCSFYKPRNVSNIILYTSLIKLYANVKYGIADCKLTKLSDIHFACASDTNYVVFTSDRDIQEKKVEDKEQPGYKRNDDKSTITIKNYDNQNIKKELNNALIEICKILGGDPTTELTKPDLKSSSYGFSGSCTRVSDSKCEMIGSMSTYESGRKICELYDIQNILNIKIEKDTF